MEELTKEQLLNLEACKIVSTLMASENHEIIYMDEFFKRVNETIDFIKKK